MIQVTRLNGSRFHVNALMIETVEETPDTLITLTNGKKYIVIENASDVIQAIQQYLRNIGLVGALSAQVGRANPDLEGASS
jgi:flagellar protein FlbD